MNRHLIEKKCNLPTSIVQKTSTSRVTHWLILHTVFKNFPSDFNHVCCFESLLTYDIIELLILYILPYSPLLNM